MGWGVFLLLMVGSALCSKEWVDCKGKQPTIVLFHLDDISLSLLGIYNSPYFVTQPHHPSLLTVYTDNTLNDNAMSDNAMSDNEVIRLLHNPHSLFVHNFTNLERDNIINLLHELDRGEVYERKGVGYWFPRPPHTRSYYGDRSGWPLQHGFHNFYGTYGGWPNLFEDNSFIDTPKTSQSGSAFQEAMNRQALHYVRTNHLASCSPLFLYYAPGPIAEMLPHLVCSFLLSSNPKGRRRRVRRRSKKADWPYLCFYHEPPRDAFKQGHSHFSYRSFLSYDIFGL